MTKVLSPRVKDVFCHSSGGFCCPYCACSSECMKKTYNGSAVDAAPQAFYCQTHDLSCGLTVTIWLYRMFRAALTVAKARADVGKLCSACSTAWLVAQLFRKPSTRVDSGILQQSCKRGLRLALKNSKADSMSSTPG